MRKQTLMAWLFAPAVFLGTINTNATVIERVVAVVGEQPILMSELHQRSKPFLVQIHQRVPSGAQKAAAESELLRQMLTRMIDERVEQQAATKHRLNVTAEELDAAITRLAGMQNMSVDQLIAEATRSGLTAQEYRDELRRQILEGKLLELRVKGRVRVTDEDMKATFTQLVREERQRLPYRLQWIVIRMPKDASPVQREERRLVAESILQKARTGASFSDRAKRYSDDNGSRDRGGDLGQQQPGALDESIEKVVLTLDVGQVAAPFAYADALIILRLAGRDPSKIGTFEEVKDQLAQRVYADQLEKAKRKWLDGLKRGMHVDVRL